MQKRAVKRAVSLCKLMVVFSLLIFTSRFVDQSHSRLFVEFYIRACDKLTLFSKYARAYVWGPQNRRTHFARLPKMYVLIRGVLLYFYCMSVKEIPYCICMKEDAHVFLHLTRGRFNYLHLL